MSETIKVTQYLLGHTSQNTAHVTEDYPYGSLRCQRREWLEYKENKGYRFVTQTKNPKNGQWNKPHASTYTLGLAFMYLDEIGHTQCAMWIGFNWRQYPLETFVQYHIDALQDDISQFLIATFKITIDKYSKKSHNLTEC